MTEARRLALAGRQKKRRSPSRLTAGRTARVTRVAHVTHVTWSRLIVAVFALFLHATRISEAWLIEHALCEHGEVVHAGHAGAGGAAPHEVTPEQTEEAHSDASASASAHLESSRGAEDQHHDHCVASSLHHRTGDIGPSVAEPSLLVIALPPGVTAQPETRPIALLSLAPKGSPPRAPRLLS